MPVDKTLHTELEKLAATADRENRTSQGSVSARWSREAHAACTAITRRLKAAGVDRVIAQWTTTIWILGAGKVSVKEYAEQWIAERDLEDRTRELYVGYLRNHIGPALGGRMLCDLSPPRRPVAAARPLVAPWSQGGWRRRHHDRAVLLAPAGRAEHGRR